MKLYNQPVKPSTTPHAVLGLSKAEVILLITVGVFGLIALFGPHIPQYAGYHNFADQKTWLGILHVWDVLSNLPFAFVGICGVLVVRRNTSREESSKSRDMGLLFFYGLIVTSFCSSFYHLNPDNSSLWLDRLGMTAAFAGMLGVAITNRVSDRAGQVAAYTALIAGPISLWMWQTTGSLMAWSMLQGGGMLIVLGVAMLPAINKELRIPLAAMIGWYAISKVCELADHQIYGWSQEIISGHSLKHIVASFAGLPLIAFYQRLGRNKVNNCK